jgi:hypothetical protein
MVAVCPAGHRDHRSCDSNVAESPLTRGLE